MSWNTGCCLSKCALLADMISQMLDVVDMEYLPDAAAMPAYWAPEGRAVQQLQPQHGDKQLPNTEQQQQGWHAIDQQNGGAAGQSGGEVESVGAAAPGVAMADCSASMSHPAAVSGGVAERQGSCLQVDGLKAAEGQGCWQHPEPSAGVYGSRSVAEEWPQTKAGVLAIG